MANVLVTCVGSGVGQSVIDSLNLLRNHKIFGCDANRNVYANHYCDKFYIVPSIYSEEYLDFIKNLCLNEKIDIIVPGHDHELLILSKNIDKFEGIGIKIIVSKPDLIEISRDKFDWYNYFKKYNCAIVPTFRVSEFKKDPDKTMFPAIIKPAGGSASQGILILNDISELSLANDNDIIQPYLFPTKDDPNYNLIKDVVRKGRFVQMSEISIQLIFNKKSEFSGIFISKNSLKSGVPIFIDPIDPESFEYIDEIMKFVPICKEKKVVGPVNIQGRITEKGLVFFEMNMRFTGITGNRAQLGFNEVDFLVSDFLDLPAKLNDYSRNKLGVRQVACTTINRETFSKQKKTYTLLGAGGNIGSNIVKELVYSKNYHKIYLVCRSESYEKYKTKFQFSNVEIIKDEDSFLQTAYNQSDVVINCVSALAFKPDIEKFNSIIFQHKQVIKLIKANVPLVINVSSQSVYDQIENIEKNEFSKINIHNTYSFQKYITEQFFDSINSFSPMTKVISLRFSRVIGVDLYQTEPTGFFANVINSLLNNKTVEVPNPFNNTNLIDIKDVIGSILFIIKDSNWFSLPNRINVGGTNISLKDYCNKAIECLNLESKRDLIKFGESKDVLTSSMIDTKLFESYSWSNKYKVENTIKEIADFFIN